MFVTPIGRAISEDEAYLLDDQIDSAIDQVRLDAAWDAVIIETGWHKRLLGAFNPFSVLPLACILYSMSLSSLSQPVLAGFLVGLAVMNSSCTRLVLRGTWYGELDMFPEAATASHLGRSTLLAASSSAAVSVLLADPPVAAALHLLPFLAFNVLSMKAYQQWCEPWARLSKYHFLTRLQSRLHSTMPDGAP